MTLATRPLGRGVLGAALALTLAVPSAARAQQTEAELLQRLDSLRPLVAEAARGVAAMYRQRRRDALLPTPTVRTDTLRIGPLRVVTAEGTSVEARTLIERVWTEHYAGFVERSPSLDGATFTFGVSSRDLFGLFGGRPARRLDVDGRVPQARREDHVRQAIGAVLWEDADPEAPVSRWAGSTPFGAYEPERAYRLVATTPSRGARACLAGEVAACATAIGLGTEPRPALDAWYTPEERRALVLRSGVGGDGDVRRRLCVQQGRIDACDALLLEEGGVLAPLTGTLRGSLLRLALERGGRGAWSRLLADAERPALEALAESAESEPEELLGAWSAELVDGRPEVHAGLAGRSLLALLWILFFAALATRSTRWRSR